MKPNFTCLLSISLLMASVFLASAALLRFDFNQPSAWAEPSAPVGTVDQADTPDPSGGLRIAGGKEMTSGPLPVKTAETDLGKLTLAFDHSTSNGASITVRVESFDADKRRTGGLEITLHPPAPDFYQRAAIELSRMTPAGEGKFSATDPFVQIRFASDAELRIDNLTYDEPAFYVAPDGSDANDGRSENTAFATPAKALAEAQPGDIVVLKNGTYSGSGDAPVAAFSRPGAPAAWITLKNYPGHQPKIMATGRSGVSILQTKALPTLAYLEVRGLHIRGDGDVAQEKYPNDLGKLTPNTNAVGIVANGRATPYPGERTPNEIIHHIRLADNLVEFCAADGIYAEYVDWFYVENNKIRNNCWATIGFAPAGFSVMGFANFDLTDNVPKMLISGNHVSGNKLQQMNSPWGKEVKTSFFNGNGILLDANAEVPPAVYRGRTLVRNNIVHHNGAGGIQMWGNHRMDIANNTIYQNGTVVDWGQLGFEFTRDVNLVNNIVVGRPGGALDTWYPNRADNKSFDIKRVNNVYFGGIKPPIPGEGDLLADPQFVNPSEDPDKADFRLKPGSLAAGRGALLESSKTP